MRGREGRPVHLTNPPDSSMLERLPRPPFFLQVGEYPLSLVEKLQGFFDREKQSIYQQAVARLSVSENLRGEVAEIVSCRGHEGGNERVQ